MRWAGSKIASLSISDTADLSFVKASEWAVVHSHKYPFFSSGTMRPNAVEILFEKFPTCWHSPKNGLRSVLIFGSGNFLIASVSSGSGLKLFSETTYSPNFTVCCANCNFLVFRDTSCSAARADRWRTASMCSSC